MTNAAVGLAVVLTEVGDGLEVRHQAPGQPHQLNVALGLSLKAATGLDAIEVAVDVDLQQDGRMLSRPTSFCGDNTLETESTKVEFIDEHIDHTSRVGVRHIVIQALGKQHALASMLSLDKTLHRHSPLI